MKFAQFTMNCHTDAMQNGTKILFLVPYPLNESPSQRFRFEQYAAVLCHRGFQIRVQSFLDVHGWQIFFASGKYFQKVWALLVGFVKRWAILIEVPFFDFVFIHREVAPLGPPVFEWILAKVFRKRIIYDFDDAIWLTDRTREPWIVKTLKWRQKTGSICRWSYKVSCGNDYLANYAKKYNTKFVFNPTTIDTEGWHNPDLQAVTPDQGDCVVIGWTGSHSTLKYLEGIAPVLEKIERDFVNVQVVIIADRKPAMKLRSMVFIPWNKKTEVVDLMKIDIGIMPLPNDEWSQGKCGFKALQYMALGKPVVASAVGANNIIIDDGTNGFLISSFEQWEYRLTQLILEKALRKKMGESGRRMIQAHYSVISNTSNFVSLFE
jgi:glycosyltransferase involved in cell wall biosynthesis